MFSFLYFFFFFSSRRRHTRLQGDWSSDVCSSDLRTAGTAATFASRIMAITHAAVYDSVNALARTHEVYLRSEERRVGKECRSRGAAEHEKRKNRSMTRERSGHVHNKERRPCSTSD